MLGLKYGYKSLIGMIGCSFGITIGETIGSLTTDFILAALYGGLISGIGMALTYRAGGSTGGTDLIAKLVQYKKPHMNLGNILLVVDGIIIAILAITFKNINVALYSVVAVFVMTKVLNLILEGVDYAKAVFVITNKPEEISDLIHEEIKRTTTKIEAIGTYTHEEKTIFGIVSSSIILSFNGRCLLVAAVGKKLNTYISSCSVPTRLIRPTRCMILVGFHGKS